MKLWVVRMNWKGELLRGREWTVVLAKDEGGKVEAEILQTCESYASAMEWATNEGARRQIPVGLDLTPFGK